MRKQDIIITTPEHSTIYGWNTLPKNNPKVWSLDRSGKRSKPYLPSYVLEIDGGQALVLYAHFVPDTDDANRWEQASLVDAAGYSLADYKKRQEVMEKFSHWHSSEERKERDAALDKLKPVPKGWEIRWTPTSYIRVLWAEVERIYQEGIDNARAEREKRAAEDKRQRDEWHAWVDKIAESGAFTPERIAELKSGGRTYYVGGEPTGVVLSKSEVEYLCKSTADVIAELSA